MKLLSVLTILIAYFYLASSQSRHIKTQFNSVRKFETYPKPEPKQIVKSYKNYNSRLINEKPVTLVSSSPIDRNSQYLENEESQFQYDNDLSVTNKEELQDYFFSNGSVENNNFSGSLLTNGLEALDRLWLDGGATESAGLTAAALIGGIIILTIIFPFIVIPVLLILKLIMVLPMVKLFELPDVGAGSPTSYVDSLTRLFSGMNMNGEENFLGSIFNKNSTNNNNNGGNGGGMFGSTVNNQNAMKNIFSQLFATRRSGRSAPQTNCIEKLRCIFIKQEKDCSKYKCFPEKPPAKSPTPTTKPS